MAPSRLFEFENGIHLSTDFFSMKLTELCLFTIRFNSSMTINSVPKLLTVCQFRIASSFSFDTLFKQIFSWPTKFFNLM